MSMKISDPKAFEFAGQICCPYFLFILHGVGGLLRSDRIVPILIVWDDDDI